MFYTAKFIKIKDHSTAATSAVTSDAVDTAGYERVTFLTSFGTAAADNSVKVQQSSDDAAADAYADLEGTSVVSGTSDEDIVVTIVKPRERYLKLVATRGTSSTLESVWAILHGPVRSQPVDNTTSGTITGELHVSPAEGTA